MKKSLSLLLAIALVFSLFANAALAAEQPSLNDKYQALVDEGVFTPYPDGDPRFDELTTRGQIAKIVTLIAGLEEIEGTYSFNDNNYTKHWARPYVEAVYAAGIMQGKDLNKMIFGVNDNITIEEMAKVLATILGLEEVENAPAKAGVSKWAYGWVKAIEDAGFVLTTGNYNAAAKRSLLVEAAYQAYAALSVQVGSVKIVDSKNIEVTFTDGEVVKVELDKALEPNKENVVKVNHNGKTYNVTVKLDKVLVDKVAQSGAKKIKVTFNRGLNADEKADLTYELKFGTITYDTTVKYAEDNASVELEANYLQSGDYTVNVKGFEPFTVKVEEAKVSKLVIGAESLQKAENQDLKVQALNQFDEEVAHTPVNITVSAPGDPITVNSGKVDLSKLKVDDVVVVTAIYNVLAVSKTFKIVDPSSATAVTLGQVSPVEGKTRISVNEEGLILPYTFTDQYGQKVKLSGTLKKVNDNTVAFGDIQFTSSNTNIIDPNNFTLEADGTLKFKTGSTAGIATILVVNLKNGASNSVQVKVEESSGKVAKFDLMMPNVGQIVADESVTFEYAAVDNYGQQIDKNKFASRDFNDQIELEVVGAKLNGNPKWDAKGNLILKFAGSGPTIIFVYQKDASGNKVGILDQLSIDVKEKSKPVNIVGLKGLATVFGVNGEATVGADNVNIIDNYGRNVGDLKDDYALKVTVESGDAISVTGAKLKGVKEGTSKIKVQLQLKNVDVPNAAVIFDAKVVKDSDIASFEIESIPTLFAANSASGKYAKPIKVVGKLANGQQVAIKQDNYVERLSSSNLGVVNFDDTTVYGVAKGDATITVWDNKGNALGKVDVKVSDVPPYADTVKIADGATEKTIVGQTDLTVEVLDQYGQNIADQSDGDGFWYSSNQNVVTVDKGAAKGIVKPTATSKNGDSATITFVTKTGVSASIVIFVEK